jgi:two-component system phosphate regulon sensor histidine kinase PhoR
MTQRPLVLIIGGAPDYHDWEQGLVEKGLAVATTTDDDRGHQEIERLEPDVVVVHPGDDCGSGQEALARVRRLDPSIGVVMICGDATVWHAVEAMKLGAAEFVAEPPPPSELALLVDRALEKRRSQQRHEAVERERDQVRSNLISIVSHEMRSPLLFVKQCLQLLLDGDVGSLDGEARSVLESASNRLELALELAVDWLTISRIKSGDILGEASAVEVAAVLEEAVSGIRDSAIAGDITVQVGEVPSDIQVIADTDNLRLVFSNLLENAVKFNRPGGTIRVDVSTDNGTVKVTVADTGLGIPEADVPFVFDEFFRSSMKEKRKIHGTGLGLSIVERMVEGYGGKIRVESTEGEGSTFVLSLPSA